MTWFLIVVIVIVACALYFLPGIDATLRKLLIGICVVCFILWLLMILGVFGGGGFYVRSSAPPTLRVP